MYYTNGSIGSLYVVLMSKPHRPHRLSQPVPRMITLIVRLNPKTLVAEPLQYPMEKAGASECPL